MLKTFICYQLLPLSTVIAVVCLAFFLSDTHDRQILNPIPENSRSYSVSEATFSLAHSCLLCGIYIPPNQNLVINSDDLKDFYHGFILLFLTSMQPGIIYMGFSEVLILWGGGATTRSCTMFQW